MEPRDKGHATRDRTAKTLGLFSQNLKEEGKNTAVIVT
jgi:hypothetical protein